MKCFWKWAARLVALGALGQALCAQGQALDCAHVTPVPWRAVAPGVWAWLPERLSEIAPENKGHVQPITVIADAGEALVVDPGPNHYHGQRVRASLACQFGAQPRWVVNTHAHAENVLGNSAFADLQAAGQVTIMASAGTRDAMQRRCQQCLQRLTETLKEMAGTQIVLPDRILAEGDELAVGRLRIQVLMASHAHTESDLLLWLPAQGLLWAGGLVYDGRVPELAQGSVKGWLEALQRMAALRPQVVVGSVISTAPDAQTLPPAISSTNDYLQGLRTRLSGAMDAGQYGSETQSMAWTEHADWVGFHERQGFNVQRAWRELESEWMDGTQPVNSQCQTSGGSCSFLR